MSNEGVTTKLLLSAHPNTSNSASPTTLSPSSSSILNGEQQQTVNLNGNGILHENKLGSNHYQNGILSDLQSAFPSSSTSSWNHSMDPLIGGAGEHSFDIQNSNRMFDAQATSPSSSYQQPVHRRPITAAHNFPSSIPSIRTNNGMSSLPMNGRWNNSPSSVIGPPPPHLQQQQQPSPWNAPAMSHGFPSTSTRRPVPSMNNNPMSTGKTQGNPFSFLPSNNSNPNPMRRTPMMANLMSTNNGDLGQNFPSINPGDAYDMSSFNQLVDMMRHVSSDGVKRVYSEDSGMGSLLDAESLMSVGGGPSSTSSSGLFNSTHSMPIDMSKEERFSRKVFVGGLPPDIDEEEIIAHFQRFGPLVVDWPHKQESKSYFPPKGYAFLIFTYERSVQDLIDECVIDDSKLYMCVSSPSMKDKAVQIRPWLLADSDFVMDGTQPLDPRKTIFVGGVPRPLRAVELAMIMDRLYGGVCYAGIDTDPELKYPKGAGRVAFSNQQSYIAAISARFVQLQHGDIDKRVEVKPYVLDDQLCDECAGARCGGKFAPFFCANVTCLQYYCETCWGAIHARAGREYHKPLVKEGADRPRSLPFRW